MTSSVVKKRQLREQKQQARKWWLSARKIALWVIGTCVLGALFGLYAVRAFVGFLSGPKVNAMVQGLRGTTEKTIGCTYYSFVITTDEHEPVEYVYLKLQFPGQITGYKVGLPSEAETANGRINMQAWEAGKNSKGECDIIQAAVNNSADVQSAASGNMITVHGSKFPPKTNIMGMAATSSSQSSVNPPPKLYSEGAYEYTKLGQIVRKPLPVSNRGVTDAK